MNNIFENIKFLKEYDLHVKRSGELNKNIERPILISLLRDKHYDNCLDMGCGSGELCNWLFENDSINIIGIDISQEQINRAKIKFKYGNFQCQNILHFEITPNHYQLITASLMLHYISDLDLILRRCFEGLQKNGNLVFSILHPLKTSKMSGKPYSINHKFNFEWLGFNTIIYHRTFSTLINVILKNKFRIVEIVEYDCSYDFKEKHKQTPPFIFFKLIKI